MENNAMLFEETGFPNWTIEEFDAIEENHHFTGSYKRQKTRLLRAHKRELRRRRHFGMPAAAAIALTCILGTATVFAATSLYRFTVNKTAAHSVDLGLESTESNAGGTAVPALEKENAESAAGGAAVPADDSVTAASTLPAVEVLFGFLPDNVSQSEKGDYYYTGASGDYGYYTDVLAVDTSADWTEKFVKNAEPLTIQGRDALLVEKQTSTDVSWANRDLYISFPEVHRIVHIWAWGKSNKEELLKIAENISLQETGEVVALADLPAWSHFAAYKNGDFDDPQTVEPARKTVATLEEMAQLHAIGEPFTADTYSSDGFPIEITVKDATVSDDLSSLTNAAQIPEDWLTLIGDDGKLKTDDLLYVQYGDGENSLNTIVKCEPKTLKLLQVTVQYKNTGDTDLENVVFFGSTMRLHREGDTWKIAMNDAYDDVYHETGSLDSGEMRYYDITGGERNNNYIPELKSGQSRDVHMAWIVDADSLDQIYLNLSPSANWNSFSEEDLKMGYVDLGL